MEIFGKTYQTMKDIDAIFQRRKDRFAADLGYLDYDDLAITVNKRWFARCHREGIPYEPLLIREGSTLGGQ